MSPLWGVIEQTRKFLGEDHHYLSDEKLDNTEQALIETFAYMYANVSKESRIKSELDCMSSILCGEGANDSDFFEKYSFLTGAETPEEREKILLEFLNEFQHRRAANFKENFEFRGTKVEWEENGYQGPFDHLKNILPLPLQTFGTYQREILPPVIFLLRKTGIQVELFEFISILIREKQKFYQKMEFEETFDIRTSTIRAIKKAILDLNQENYKYISENSNPLYWRSDLVDEKMREEILEMLAFITIDRQQQGN